MKKSHCFFFKTGILLLLFIGFGLHAQTEEQARRITASYDQSYLVGLAAEALEKSVSDRNEAVQYAQSRNLPVAYTTQEGSFVELQRVLPDGSPIYYKTNNKDAAISTRTVHLHTGGSTSYNLDGQNMTAYVWDGGHPRATHQEYDGLGGNDRVSIMDVTAEGGVSLHFHAAHVVGTIAASGVQAQAKGMAPQAKVNAYKWNDDIAEGAVAASNGMLISNHSYGFDATLIPDQWFGAYQEDAMWWDNIMANAPYFLMVKSAGNDGADNSSNTIPLLFGYDKLNGAATAKNNLVVAAAQDAIVDSNGNLVSVDIMDFSSQGPTDDLRIKPDITGNGQDLFSTYESSDTMYGTISGTSMAAPNVTGSLLLLQQHYNNLNGNFMRAATLKALALHTADDTGPIGPDAIWGWGLLNAKKAAETIAQNGSGSLLHELVISQGQTITFTVASDGITDLMASISWTDPPGTINTATNSSIAALVNDLDIRIQKGGTTYYPWRLTSATTNANDGDNTKDPYERIDIDNASGTYTITISHKGILTGGSQAFSLVVTGLEVECVTASVPQNIRFDDVKGTRATISWDIVPGSLYDLRYRKIGETAWIEVGDLTANYEITGLELDTDYEVQVRGKCPAGVPSGYSASIIFSTATTFIYCESVSNYSDPDFHISNVKLNTIDNTSTGSTYSDFTALDTDLMAGQTYAISITTTADLPYYLTAYSVWIDFNGNEEFENQGEQIFTMVTVSGTVATGFVTIPVDAVPMSTTMRVSMVNSGLPPGPCDFIQYGEVEDYTINILNATDFVYEDLVWTPENPNGVSTSMDNIHIINGTAVFYDDISANNIIIDIGATLNVEKVLTIAGDLIIDGDLVFVSNVSGNGELGPVANNSTITGEATVQRYMANRRSYRMVSSAVSTSTSIHDNWQEAATSNVHDPNMGFGTHITGTINDQQNGFDATATGNPSMFTVDVANQQFVPITNTDSNKLNAGEAYLLFVRGNRGIDLTKNNVSSETVLRAKGVLHTGPHVQNFVAADAGDFVMLGNPYQSAVDVNSVLSNSTNLNIQHYYVFDPNMADHGAYVTVDLPTGTNLFGSQANQFLQPGQGAQVAILADGPSSLVFDEADKSPGNFTVTHRPFSHNNMLTVQLFTVENFINGGPVHDGFGIVFAEGNDNAITPADAIKPMNFNENIGVFNDGQYLSLERRAMPQAAEVYQMYSTGYKHEDYTFKLRVEGLEDSFLFLDDRYTGTVTLLDVGENIYDFNVNKNDPQSTANDRFVIRSEKRLDINDNNLLTNIRLFPNPVKGNSFHVAAPNLTGKKLHIEINDLSGRSIFERMWECDSDTVSIEIDENMASGVYLVVLKNGTEKVVKRLIKE